LIPWHARKVEKRISAPHDALLTIAIWVFFAPVGCLVPTRGAFVKTSVERGRDLRAGMSA
jgi:hypothetical protein